MCNLASGLPKAAMSGPSWTSINPVCGAGPRSAVPQRFLAPTTAKHAAILPRTDVGGPLEVKSLSALNLVRVVDCSEGTAGPMAAMYLADFGADVVKVERPSGDRARSNPGFPLWNRSKRSVVLDLGALTDRERLRAFLRGADVCVFSQPLGELERIEFDPVTVRALNPGIVYLHMPAFSSHGPGGWFPESVELLAAESGVSASQYSFEDVPVDPVIPHVLYGQAIWAAACAAAALFEREGSGFGQTATVGGLHGWAVTMTGAVTRRPGTPVTHAPGGPGGPIPFYRLYQCQDEGWLFMAGLTQAFHTQAFAALGVLEEIIVDARIGGELLAVALPENAPWVIEIIARAFRGRPRDEWIRILREAGCPCGPVWDRSTWFDHEQVGAIGMRVSLADPERGLVEMPGIPLNLTRSPAGTPAPAPTLGQHSTTAEPWPLRPAPEGTAPVAAGPLAEVKVLDLGAIIAGTYAGSLLASLGADVIKVEPLSGDNLRAFGPTFFGYNLGKRSVCMDLRSDAGREAFYRLVRQADVVIDNYRPGVLERLKIDYSSLSAINSKVVCVSVTGYGEGGPLGSDPGFDPLLQAASGMMQAQGGESEPVFYSLPVNDVASAATAALGAVLALYHRQRTHKGQRVWTSLAAQSLMMQSAEVVRFEGRSPARTGGADFGGPSPFDRLYRVSDGWIRVQAKTDSEVNGLVESGFLLADELAEAGAESALAKRLRALDRSETVERLRLASVPASPVRTLAEVVIHPQFRSERVVQELRMADGSAVYATGAFAAFSRTQAPLASAVPGMGEHSREVLEEWGFSSGEVTNLVEQGVVREGAPLWMP